MYRVASSADIVGAHDGPAWTNRLIHAESVHLQQHAHDPVDWHPWGEEAFALAQELDRPVLLSTGYAACHWCHLMARETFSDPRIAVRLNERFITIKVDRDEYPEVDAQYIRALHGLNGTSGWPANLFLDHERVPFAGATYVPSAPHGGMTTFRDLVDRIAVAWTHHRASLTAPGMRAFAHAAAMPDPDASLDEEDVRLALNALLGAVDPTFGGFGQGSKFPQVPALELLLLTADRDAGGSRRATVLTAAAIVRNGLRDHLGGGFHRYCADPEWTVPHFEKMLFDNAQLLRWLARCATVVAGWREGDAELAAELRGAARDTADWLLDTMQRPDGLFAASQAADDALGEGAFHTFTEPEARAALGDLDPLPYGIRPEGNWRDGRTVLSVRTASPSHRTRQALAEAQAARPRPPRDDRAIVAWNGLAVGALAEAGRLFERETWVAAAATAADALLALRDERGLLPRAAGSPLGGSLRDHASLADGLLALHEAAPSPRWLREARALVAAARLEFRDPDGGWYGPREADALLVRRKDVYDGAEPSGAGRLSLVLARLALLGDADAAADLEALLTDAGGAMAATPRATPDLWRSFQAMHAVRAPKSLVLRGAPDDPALLALRRAWDRRWRPLGMCSLLATTDTHGLEMLAAQSAEGPPTAWVCLRDRCYAPTSAADELAAMLG